LKLLLPRLPGFSLLDSSWRIFPATPCFSGGCFQALRALTEGFTQLLEGPALKPDFLSKRRHGRPQRIKVTAAAAGLPAFQRRKRISVLKRSEQPGGQSLRRLLIGHRAVKPRLETAYNSFPRFA
jgi:hypothetical protein